MKFSQQASNQIDGNKNGASWRLSTKNHLCCRVSIVLDMLKWAEDSGKISISHATVAALDPFMDEDPAIIDHLLLAFFNCKLTGLAREHSTAVM